MPLPTTANTARPRAQGLHVRIDTNYYRLAGPIAEPGRIQGAPLESEDLAQASSPEEVRPEYGAVYARSDLSGGEGLDFAHTVPPREDAERRYWESRDLDFQYWTKGDVGHARLAPAIASRVAAAATLAEGRGALAYDGTRLYLAANSAGNLDDLAFSDNASVVPSVWTTGGSSEDPGAGTAQLRDVDARDGVTFAASNDGIYRKLSGAWAAFSTALTQRVWYVKDRVFAHGGSGLAYYPSARTATIPVAHTVLLNGILPFSVADAGSAILVGCGDGNVYAYADLSGTLTLRAQSAFAGPVMALGVLGNQVLVSVRELEGSTTLRGQLWLCRLDGDYTLQDRQLLREWTNPADGTSPYPYDISVIDDIAYFGVPHGSGVALWKYDFRTGGLHRWLWTGSLGQADLQVTSIVKVGQQFHFSVFDFSAVTTTVYQVVTDYTANVGYVVLPFADLFTAAEKSWVAIRADLANTSTNLHRVRAYICSNPDYASLPDTIHASDPNLGWVLVKTWTGNGTTTDVTIPAGASGTTSSGETFFPTPVYSRWLSVMLKVDLNGGAATTSPEIRSVAVRAYPGPSDVLLELPISVSDHISKPGRQAHTIKGHGDSLYDALKADEGRAVQLELLRTGDTYNGIVETVGFRVRQPTRRGSIMDVATVRFRGRRTS